MASKAMVNSKPPTQQTQKGKKLYKNFSIFFPSPFEDLPQRPCWNIFFTQNTTHIHRAAQTVNNFSFL